MAELKPDDARQARKEGVLRWVLLIALSGAVIGLILVALFL